MKKKSAFALLYIATIVALLLLSSCGSTQKCCAGIKVKPSHPVAVQKSNFTKKHYSLN